MATGPESESPLRTKESASEEVVHKKPRGLIGGMVLKFLKRGICGLSPEERRRISQRGGKAGGPKGGKTTGRMNVKLKRGICAPGVAAAAGRASASKAKERGSGVYDPAIRAHGLHVRRDIVTEGCKYCHTETPA